MVSLINFKTVNDELQLQQQHQHQHQLDTGDRLGHPLVIECTRAAQSSDLSSRVVSKESAQDNSIQVLHHEESQRPERDSPSRTKETKSTTSDPKQTECYSLQDQPKSIFMTNHRLQTVNRQSPALNESGSSIVTNRSNEVTLFSALNPFGGQKSDSKSKVSELADCEVTNFVVTWRNLRFAIKSKWHHRIASSNPLASIRGPKPCKVSISDKKPGTNLGPILVDNNNRSCIQIEANSQAQLEDKSPEVAIKSAYETKVVLDLLDGSFRSGELTAILGPSGAGKTTLLDCLTGHRKHGLSGSIKISATQSCNCCTCCYCCPSPVLKDCSSHNYPKSLYSKNNNGQATATNSSRYVSQHSYSKQRQQHHQQQLQQQHQQQQYQHHDKPATDGPYLTCRNRQQASAPSANGDNLKVSIIPQNDHLMGHLTVYETLNYASKMKNCFDKQFDHKLNIRHVAQQLGLMSCLGTRINKLSGGQYKRVSIAQELLSSPDILILDEPTSGLDAMTCYQTVQVLRKLTDDRKSNGQNPIAVILTIHQPNSDVFQQFNHVYVVAQGGRCIYEGPPSSIESTINRVGIQLPNSYYNPATMIVEIAAGKFGLEAIKKLNSIQKKQYDFQVPDEQTSTGDSAVDCPSSSSSLSSMASNDEDEENGDRSGRLKNAGCESIKEINNNSQAGLVNGGFIMDNDADINDNYTLNDKFAGSESNNNNGIVVIVGGVDDDQRYADKVTAEANDKDSKRKKKRKVKKRSDGQLVPKDSTDTPLGLISPMICPVYSASASGSDPSGGGSGPVREKRLKLNSLKADQKFPFWRHTYLHFHRSWLSIVRDPMLCSMQLALHIIVPVMVSLVYGTNVGKPNACPRAGPMDIMAYALEPDNSMLQLQEDLRTTLENIGYIFFKLYGIIFAAMTVTVLTFPLDMHVLVKEFRNGWYGLSSYFLGRTLADIPFQLTLPLLAMSLSYYATGQPYSYMQWRFLSITGILILSSLIAQSQGLLFGAILMDRMKAAVFVAPAATTPIILFAGFLVRTKSIPHYLRPLSDLSYLRYAIEACLISRYGFDQCECDPSVFNQTVPELPPIARSMLDYWLTNFKTNQFEASNESTNLLATNSTTIETTTIASVGSNQDLLTKLIDSLSKANSFGRNITSCEQVVPYPMIDYDLKDSQLFNCFAILIFMLIFTRLLTFFIVCFKVKRKV